MMAVAFTDKRSAGFGLLGKLHLRMLRQQPQMDILALVLLAIVCGLIGLGLMLSAAIDHVFESSGDPETVLIMAHGSHGEAESFMNTQSSARLRALLSAEGLTALAYDRQLVMSTSIVEKGVQKFLFVRGMTPEISQGAQPYRIVEGEMFDSRFNQIIVGRATQRAFPAFQVGSDVDLANKSWLVTGIFEMGGDIRENEVVADLQRVQAAYGAEDFLNTVRIKAADQGQVERILDIISSDETNEFTAMTENEYFIKQSLSISKSVSNLQMLVMGLMIPTALLGLLSIQRIQRTNMMDELRMLNFIGFQSRNIELSLLVRSTLIGVAAACVASLILSMGIAGRSLELDLSFQIVDIQFTVSPWIYGSVLLGAVVIAPLASLMSSVIKEIYQ